MASVFPHCEGRGERGLAGSSKDKMFEVGGRSGRVETASFWHTSSFPFVCVVSLSSTWPLNLRESDAQELV